MFFKTIESRVMFDIYIRTTHLADFPVLNILSRKQFYSSEKRIRNVERLICGTILKYLMLSIQEDPHKQKSVDWRQLTRIKIVYVDISVMFNYFWKLLWLIFFILCRISTNDAQNDRSQQSLQSFLLAPYRPQLWAQNVQVLLIY